MDYCEVILLSIIQGITEFLPISSSAHLLLPASLFGWQAQSLTFDVSVHFGTLLAVMIYFREKILSMVTAVCNPSRGDGANADAQLAWMIVAATLPAVVAGFVVNMYLADDLRQLWVIATTTIIFGLLLWYADGKAGEATKVTMRMALIIGFSQCLALLPGTSRSGITMTAALLTGLSKTASAEFSFLLSIPLIMAASILKSYDCIQTPEMIDWQILAIAIFCSFVSALVCIYGFMQGIQKIGYKPFVIYRLLLGGMLLFWL